MHTLQVQLQQFHFIIFATIIVCAVVFGRICVMEGAGAAVASARASLRSSGPTASSAPVAKSASKAPAISPGPTAYAPAVPSDLSKSSTLTTSLLMSC